MTKITKLLLTISLVGLIAGLAFVTGLVNVQNAVGFYVALPLGAVFFGLFLVFRMLDKEAALYDEEHQLHPVPVKEQRAGCDCSIRAHGKAPAAH